MLTPAVLYSYVIVCLPHCIPCFLGAVDSSLHISPPAWAAMSAAGFYSVSVTGMALVSLSRADAAADGTPASSAQTVVALDVSSFRGGETIVDSGTT